MTARLTACQTLDDLLAYLRTHGTNLRADQWSDLPVFGGVTPGPGQGYDLDAPWSWDATRLLVTDGGKLRIVPRV